MLLRIDELRLRRVRQLGLAGSVVLLVGAIAAGVLPRSDALMRMSAITVLRGLTTLTVAVVFIGVSLLLVAWWRLGRLVRRREPLPPRAVVTTLAWWAAPLVISTPIFSRDVYSYLAQGSMVNIGIDAYQFGPARMGGPLALDVPEIWQHTPAPYGPTFLSVAADVVGLSGETAPRMGIFGMRLLALVGVGLLVWSVPKIAKTYGVDPSGALWLGVLNPLVLLHLIVDAHNDALMLGLMLAGLALAHERRPVAGTILITLGALVKAPAALALVFLVPIWREQLAGRHRTVRAAGAIGAITVAASVIVTMVAGTGYGWIGALDTPTRAHTWTSITTDFGVWTGYLTAPLGLATADQALAFWRLVGLAAAATVILILYRRREQIGAVPALGLGLGAVVILGPVLHPWYLLWAMVPLAAASRSPRIRRAVLVTSVAFTLLVIPGGVQPSIAVFSGLLIGALVVLLTDREVARPAILGFRLRPGRARRFAYTEPAPAHQDSAQVP